MIISSNILDKLKTFIGFSIKARKVINGSENILKQASRRRIKLIIIDSRVADNTKKKMEKVSIINSIQLFSIDNWQDLKINEAIKVIAIQNCELADTVEKLLLKNEIQD
jgi:ribosomal protein L7Ae-like RNA K-turn-binding protein